MTTLDLSWRDAALYEGPYRLRQHVVFDDAAVRALAERCRNLTTVVLRGCTGLSHAAVAGPYERENAIPGVPTRTRPRIFFHARGVPMEGWSSLISIALAGRGPTGRAALL